MKDQEINLYMREVIDTMNEGLFLISPNGTIMMVNDALLKMTGFKREELLGKPCSVFGCDACEQSRELGKQHWCRLFNTRKEGSKNCYIISKNGSYLHVLKNASILKNENGEIIGAVETLTDISELDRKELKIQELSLQLNRDDKQFCGFIGNSAPMQKVYTLIKKAAQSDAPVIIFGESGTGKELAAQAIHQLSPRKDKPFVQLNCAALNDALLESELFGHVKGSFTGAYRHRSGRFEEAGSGDIFLDEIGDVPLHIQVKLLRVLETKSFERVGDSLTLSMNARLITATNQNLQELVRDKKFREDFFFRINVIPVYLPPLRDRKGDLHRLVEHFINTNPNLDKSESPTPETMRKLIEYDWPGNVRELKSALEYAAVVKEAGPMQPEHLPPQIVSFSGEDYNAPSVNMQKTPPRGLTEKEELISALKKTSGNKSEAARILNVSRGTIHNRIRKHGIEYRIYE
ncbi:sigma 54-interacting transcriptional regulator [Desulfovibrio sp. UCD-KL4C]|uniref:sigma-54 interaction domain-containing protein n=1 Tax=Desulfovibrio sp. UCD-KL4C TaxID=2578120 RepID=UPI0025BCD67F|nr:sigma 54-interacting transcriptional regulator [Desulfovibrio sp. UCD-KL4C]